MMRTAIAMLVALSTAAAAAGAQSGAAGDAADPATGAIVLLEIDGGIGPATADYLERGIEEAAGSGARAVILRMDTPGGLDAATRDINQAILQSAVPVIVYVAPEGARAASAGTYILYAAHVAAMAPATSLGAATPVSIGGAPGPAPSKPGGKDEKSEDDDDDNDEDEGPDPGEDAGRRKAVNDAVAYLRSLAQRRGRNAEFAEAAVRDAATLTASEALERGVIEIVARDLDDLLQQLDGRAVTLPDGERTLATSGAAIERIEPDWRSQLLAVITEPSIAYILLLLGLYGLLFEGYSPGAIVPGVVGAICLLLALYALQLLPVNYAGVGLIVLGIVLMSVELFVPSFGALGIGGLVALVFGSILLFDTEIPGYGVSTPLILGIGVASGLAFSGVLYLALRARGRPVVTGEAELIGHTAVALGDFSDHGRVHVRGEDWKAWSERPIAHGQRVRVTGVDGLTLRVEPLD